MRQNVIKAMIGIFVLTALVLSGCGGGGGGGSSNPIPTSSTGSISGTVTLPAAVSSKCFIIGLDKDNIPDNQQTSIIGEIFKTVSGTTVTFTLTNLPVGTYYLISAVDVGGNSTSCDQSGLSIDPGDYAGYYGGTVSNPPVAPNVTVSAGNNGIYNFSLGVN